MNRFGENLRTLRQRANVRVEDLATVIGCSRQTIYHWEQKIILSPRQKHVEALASYFDTSPFELIFGETADRAQGIQPLKNTDLLLPRLTYHQVKDYLGGRLPADALLEAYLAGDARHPYDSRKTYSIIYSRERAMAKLFTRKCSLVFDPKKDIAPGDIGAWIDRGHLMIGYLDLHRGKKRIVFADEGTPSLSVAKRKAAGKLVREIYYWD